MTTVDHWQSWLEAAKERAAHLERRDLMPTSHPGPYTLPPAAPTWYEGKPVETDAPSLFLPRLLAKKETYSPRGNTQRGRKKTPRVLSRVSRDGFPS